MHSLNELKFARQRHKEAMERAQASWFATLPEGKASIVYHQKAIEKISVLIKEQTQ